MKTRWKTSLAVLLVPLSVGCGSTYERGDPVGKSFPTVKGSALDGEELSLPADLRGKEVVLFVGYEMDTQFDIDRWILGLQQAEVEVEAWELPTIAGMVPGLFSSRIDAGMRSGIPPEDWCRVMTVYGDAEILTRSLGNQNSLPARVLLLDTEGVVQFFHDTGYSVGAANELRKTLRELRAARNGS